MANSVEVSPAPKVFKVMSVFVLVLTAFLTVKTLQSLGLVNPSPYQRELSLEATGHAYVTPDTARLSFGVTERGADSKAIVESNNEKMNAIIALLKAEGVESKDIQTTSYVLNPYYNWSETQGSYQDGFEVSQTLTVEIKDLSKVGLIMQKATDAGATNLGSVEFMVEDEEAAKSLARQDAIDMLKEKRKEIMKATGLRLGRVVNYYEYSDPYAYGKGGTTYMEGAADMNGVANIQPGESEIQLSVTMTYQVR